MSPRQPSRPVQSLDRGLALLEAVAAARRPVSLGELTRAVGIDRSNVFRLANTLRLRGFLVQLPGSRDYVLGSTVWRLASLFPWVQVLKQVVREHVVSLQAQTGETSHVIIREGHRLVFIDHELTRQPIGARSCSSENEPLHATAVGKALLADYDRRQLVELLGEGPLKAMTSQTVSTIDALLGECRLVKKRGFALDDEECYAGLRCIASPIRDASSQVIAAIGITGPADRFPKPP